ncbi:MAG: CBS domain-containing protein [Bdellovibrionales bacterium]
MSTINPALKDQILTELDEDTRLRIDQLLSYPEESAGRMMQPKIFSLPIQITAQEGLNLLREHAKEQSIYYIYCTDKDNRLRGVISLRALVTAAPDTLNSLVKREVVTVSQPTPMKKWRRSLPIMILSLCPWWTNRTDSWGSLPLMTWSILFKNRQLLIFMPKPVYKKTIVSIARRF